MISKIFIFFVIFSEIKSQNEESVSLSRAQPLMDLLAARISSANSSYSSYSSYSSSANSSSLRESERLFERVFERVFETLFKTFFAFISETIQSVSFKCF